jgi:hypothetical protein
MSYYLKSGPSRAMDQSDRSLGAVHAWDGPAVEQGPYWTHASSVLDAGRFGRLLRSSVRARDLLPGRSSLFFGLLLLYIIVCLNRL